MLWPKKVVKKGFTLVELLLTAAILGYSLSMVMASFMSNIILSESNRNLTMSTMHAQYVLESIRNTTFANIASSISSGTWNWNTATVSSNGLTALNNESIAVTSSGTTLLTITATVNWKDSPGRSRTQSLRTMISS